MRYTPDSILVSDLEGVVAYLQREFDKISQTFDIPEVKQLNYGKEVQNTADTTTIVVNWKAGQKQRVILNASTTISFVPPEGVCNLMLVLDYNGTYTPTLPSTMLWQGGTEPTWTKTNGAVDIIAMYYDGTNYHSTASVDSK